MGTRVKGEAGPGGGSPGEGVGFFLDRGLEGPKGDGSPRGEEGVSGGGARGLEDEFQGMGVAVPAGLLDGRGGVKAGKAFEAKALLVGAAAERLGKDWGSAARLYSRAAQLDSGDKSLQDKTAWAYASWARERHAPEVASALWGKVREHLERGERLEGGDGEALALYVEALEQGPKVGGEEARARFASALRCFEGATRGKPEAARRHLAQLKVWERDVAGLPAGEASRKFEDLKLIKQYHSSAKAYRESLREGGKPLAEALECDHDRALRGIRYEMGKISSQDKALMARISLEVGDDAGLKGHLKGWHEELKGLPAERLSVPERLDRLGEMLRMGLKARDHAGAEGKRELTARLREIGATLRELGSELKAAGALEAVEVLLSRVIDHDDKALRERLTARGLEQYAQETASVRKKWEEAREVQGTKERREALLGCLRELAVLRDASKAEALAEEIRLGVGQESGDLERLGVLRDLALALSGSGFGVEAEVKELGASLAEGLDLEGLSAEGRARSYLAAAEFYQASGESGRIASWKGEMAQLREELRKASPGLGSLERLERVEIAVRLDRVLLPQEHQESKEGGGPQARLGVLEAWRGEIQGAKELSLEERLKAYGRLASQASEYGAWSRGEDPAVSPEAWRGFQASLVRDLDALLEKVGDEAARPGGSEGAIEGPLEKLSLALAAYAPLTRGEGALLSGADLQEKFRGLREKLQGRLHEAAETAAKILPGSQGDLAAEIELHLFDLVAEAVRAGDAESLREIDGAYLRGYAVELAKAEQRLKRIPKLEGQKQFEACLEAAQAFSALGIKEKVKQALSAVEQVAQRAETPAELRVELNWVAAQIYGSAGMKAESRACREAVIAAGGRGKESAQLAKGMNALEDGRIEEAVRLLAALPGNETAQALMKQAQWGLKLPEKRREAQLLAYLEASMLEFAGTKAVGGDAGSEASVKGFLGEVRGLLESGSCASFSEALEYAGRMPEHSELYKVFFVDSPNAAVFTSMQEFLKAANPCLSEEEFSGMMLKACRRMFEHDHFSGAGRLAQLLAADPQVGKEAKELMEKIPNAAFWSAMGTELRNASIIFATDFEAAVESFAFTAAGFGVGKLAAAGFRAGSALLVAKRMKAAIRAAGVAGQAAKGARLGKAAKAAAIAVEVGAMSAEAVGVTLTNINLHAWASGTKADYSHFGKEFGSMMVLFGLGRVAHTAVAKLGGGKVAQYFTGVGTFVATKYVDPLLGLKPPTEDPFWKVVIQSFVEDAGMKAGGWAAHRIPGIKRLELGAHRRMIDSQLLPKLMELGQLKEGQLSEGGTLIYHAFLGRMAKGGKPSELAKLKAWTPELLREGVEALKDLPGDAKAKEGLPPEFRTSMLQSLEKGERTEVDFVNGAVVRAGGRCGVPTPVNATLVACVKGIEHRVARPKPAG